VADALLPVGLLLAAMVLAALMYIGVVGRLDRWWIAAWAVLGVLAVTAALLLLLPRTPGAPRARPAERPPEPRAESRPEPPAAGVDPALVHALRTTAEVAARVTALSLARPEGASADAQELLSLSDQIDEALRGIGTPEPRLREIRATFNVAIVRELHGVVWRGVQRKMAADAHPAPRIREVRIETLRRLGATPPGEATRVVRPYLEQVGGWSPDVEARLLRLDAFRRTGRLPTPGHSGPPEGARSGG